MAHLIWPWWGLLECSGIFRVRSTWLVNTPFVGTGSHFFFSVTCYLPGSLGWTVPPSGQKWGTHPTQSVPSLLPYPKLWCTPHFSAVSFFSAVHHSHINEVDLPQSFPRADFSSILTFFFFLKPAQLSHNRKNFGECVPPVPPKEKMISTCNNNAILSSEKESDISCIVFFKNPIYYPGLATTNNFS